MTVPACVEHMVWQLGPSTCHTLCNDALTLNARVESVVERIKAHWFRMNADNVWSTSNGPTPLFMVTFITTTRPAVHSEP